MEYDPGPVPDSVDWYGRQGQEPTIVSISDIHGYLDAARNALTAVGETDVYSPVVTTDEEGRLHWADNDYLLVINGDLIDRGPDNRACLELLTRLAEEAPPGRIRYHLGNHEMAVLFPNRFRWPGVFSIELDRDLRRAFVTHVAAGRITAAFDGYRYTYAHAGSTDSFDVTTVNESVRTAGGKLRAMFEDGQYDDDHLDILPEHETVFGIGEGGGRGPSAGLLWMDFKHMTADAPPQIVGHSRHQEPTRTGQVVCENVIRTNLGSPGGEAVLLERPDELAAVVNTPAGARVRTMDAD
ncbi:protein tyrosine phosphatase [Halobaculum sp. WSA2]|uniref:Protein tyrosine phosphatase n=1 Tax=Halobaculum saliterrae TaxID=2073113 RepID=A0A6B0SPV0_9EURY|nr:metallophosphoesterase [Halobaculum saliterrae]MXR40735.1 protein tyrosine phosphatase [Halobaculum saliterrae]